MIWPTVAVLTSAAALTAGVVTWYAKRSLQTVRRAERHRNGFFEAAEKVVADERTPSHLAAFVVMLSMGLSNRLLPYFLLTWPVRWAPEEVRESVRKVWAEMNGLPADLRDEVEALRYHGLMAIALQSALVGSLLANRIEEAHQPPDRDHDHHDGEDRLFGRVAAFQIMFRPNESPASRLFAAP